MMTRLFANRNFLSLCTVGWFFIWAFHVATGFFDNMIAAKSGKRSGILGMLNEVTSILLVGPLGRHGAVLALVLIGLVAGVGVWKFKG